MFFEVLFLVGVVLLVLIVIIDWLWFVFLVSLIDVIFVGSLRLERWIELLVIKFVMLILMNLGSDLGRYVILILVNWWIIVLFVLVIFFLLMKCIGILVWSLWEVFICWKFKWVILGLNGWCWIFLRIVLIDLLLMFKVRMCV